MAMRFRVRLTPKGGRDAIEGWWTDGAGRAALKARVAAPPEDGKANTALMGSWRGRLRSGSRMCESRRAPHRV